ncbi:MAG: tRNA epoxyqueuosine(34) reductase QueG [Chloroflexi bacterium]|nr:tRNA epoxyqueuosine(34) reductase QueG [Chloroflexota bacterium]
MSLAEQVKQHARDLGFTLVGIAGADPFSEAEGRVVAWLRDGLNAGLLWMTEERMQRACRPEELLPGAQSAIVVGVSYRPDAAPDDEATVCGSSAAKTHDGNLDEAERSGPPPGRGIVARYAWGVDYHDVMKERLQQLAGYVRSLGDNLGDDSGGEETRTRVFVDASPLVERAAAVRAGLGFIGKNTNLLTREAGSYVLLGAVLTTLDLTPDAPILQDCGRCRLCLDACPTGALPAPFVLDANRCISYLTIEHRGAIPTDLRPLIGDRIFGCDICQEVCPWNRGDKAPGWPEFRGPLDAARPLLGELLAVDDDAFRARYRGTSLARTKRRGLLRNAAIALGNVGSADDVPALVHALADPELLVRQHAAWALGRIGGSEAADALRSTRNVEQDDDVREEIEQAIATLDTAPADHS